MGMAVGPNVESAPVVGTALASAGTAMKWAGGFSGVRDFITGVRAAFGRSGEFADRNGFDYSHIHNSNLQYNVVQAYVAWQSNKFLEHIADLTENVRGEDSKIFWGILGVIVVMLVNLVLFVAMNGKSQKQGQSVNVLSNQR